MCVCVCVVYNQSEDTGCLFLVQLDVQGRLSQVKDITHIYDYAVVKSKQPCMSSAAHVAC